jgi:hypothetical protein
MPVADDIIAVKPGIMGTHPGLRRIVGFGGWCGGSSLSNSDGRGDGETMPSLALYLTTFTFYTAATGTLLVIHRR